MAELVQVSECTQFKANEAGNNQTKAKHSQSASLFFHSKMQTILALHSPQPTQTT
ncbi:hypothetical protein [Snodgrassella alvi]|uniref:hypothetical protein n=1 Tax=Snodgrassella alvi TaxID=1196083 RepID=UPI0035122BDD